MEENSIKHFGVKGMRWGRRKNRTEQLLDKAASSKRLTADKYKKLSRQTRMSEDKVKSRIKEIRQKRFDRKAKIVGMASILAMWGSLAVLEKTLGSYGSSQSSYAKQYAHWLKTA